MDDYTCNLSVVTSPDDIGMMGFDDDDSMEGNTSSSFSDDSSNGDLDDEQNARSKLRADDRRRGHIFKRTRARSYNAADESIEPDCGFVTSLSFDCHDGESSRFACKVPPIKFETEDESFRGAPQILEVSDCSSTEGSIVNASLEVGEAGGGEANRPSPTKAEWMTFRFNYLLVTTAIMLADGLQGTHLYVLYEGYGFSVASLYCLGFVTGAVTSPITGALVDRIGRKKAALIYCALEIFINQLEQYPVLAGLIASRMIGGVTTNLLSTVFETWVDTEYRRRNFHQSQYELLMRDSVIVSNVAAIGSGYLAHQLAETCGAVGPFRGAVGCTVVAFIVVFLVWNENFGSSETEEIKSVKTYLTDAITAYRSDTKILRVGIIQGLTCGAIQIFIFLWSPVLRDFALSAPSHLLGLDSQGEPAYGLIFGAFMACGVVGGLLAPWVRRGVTALLSPLTKTQPEVVLVEGEGEIRPMAVEFLAAICYVVCAGLLLTPCLVEMQTASAFSTVLCAFLVYELLIGIYMPCEGVIRSIYIPADARCSLLTVPRIIVNIAVSLGVISTNYVTTRTAFAAVASLMIVAAGLQISLVSSREWSSLFGRVDRLKRRISRHLSSMSFNEPKYQKLRRTYSSPAISSPRMTESKKAK